MKWLQLIVPISSQIEDACVNRLQELGATAVYTHFLTDSSSLFLYGIFPYEADRKKIKNKMRMYLSSLRDLGFDVSLKKIKTQEINEDEYLHQWKDHFQPIHFGNTLVIEPVWISDSAGPGEKVLKIDPGMAFGTGHHFTTQFCLQWVCQNRESINSLIDVGCGSGIISIAASLLGIKKILAMDHYSMVMPAVKKNIERNHVQGKITLIRADILAAPLAGTFDVVIANLHINLLLKAKENLKSLLKPGASLILTGIAYNRRQDILSRYSDLFLQTVQVDTQKEWVGIWYKNSPKL